MSNTSSGVRISSLPTPAAASERKYRPLLSSLGSLPDHRGWAQFQMSPGGPVLCLAGLRDWTGVHFGVFGIGPASISGCSGSHRHPFRGVRDRTGVRFGVCGIGPASVSGCAGSDRRYRPDLPRQTRAIDRTSLVRLALSTGAPVAPLPPPRTSPTRNDGLLEKHECVKVGVSPLRKSWCLLTQGVARLRRAMPTGGAGGSVRRGDAGVRVRDRNRGRRRGCG